MIPPADKLMFTPPASSQIIAGVAKVYSLGQFA